MKYVLVSGGVISGVGKGIIASSAGLLLKTMGLKVSSIKIDPYINIDAGTMNPKEHGEVYVLDDGGEVDLDLGNYERYLNITLARDNNLTLGKVYQRVIEKERRGDYLGKTVQVVPHVTGEIEGWLQRVAKIPVDDSGEEPDVCIIELGGTIGDIEGMAFVEALCELRRNCAREDFMQIHVSYIPVVHGEQKTKPTQMAIKAVRSAGLIPDLIACRCEFPLDKSTTDKVARFCQVPDQRVLAVRDMPSTYQVPILLDEQHLISLMTSTLQLDRLHISAALRKRGTQIWASWKDLALGLQHVYDEVEIVLVGKYLEQPDSYLSVIRSLEHASMRCRRKLRVKNVDAEALEETTSKTDPASYHKAWHDLCTASGILVPGGFGIRGTEGMVAAAKWARENKVPYLGICLGMQTAVIEFARSVCDIPQPQASSSEFNPPKPQASLSERELADEYFSEEDDDEDGNAEEAEVVPRISPERNSEGGVADKPSAGESAPKKKRRRPKRAIIEMLEHNPGMLGGTMRLGLRPTVWQPNTQWSKLRALYGMQNESINERHRHRFEVNPRYIELLQAKGLTFIGKDESGKRMEIIELQDHPWFVGVQFHPEYLSRVLHPSKPYLGFIAASAGMLAEIIAGENRIVVNGVSELNVHEKLNDLVNGDKAAF